MKKTLLGVLFAALLSLVAVAPASANIVWATLAPVACDTDTGRLHNDLDYNMEIAAGLSAADSDAAFYLWVYQYDPNAVENLVEMTILMGEC